MPTDIIYANKLAKIRQLDAQLMGLFLTRAAISDVQETDLPAFMERHVEALLEYAKDHPQTLAERLQKAGSKYRWN